MKHEGEEEGTIVFTKNRPSEETTNYSLPDYSVFNRNGSDHRKLHFRVGIPGGMNLVSSPRHSLDLSKTRGVQILTETHGKKDSLPIPGER